MNKKESSFNFNCLKSIKLTEYKKFASALKRLNQSKTNDSSGSLQKIFYPNSISLNHIQVSKERPIVNMKLPKIKVSQTEINKTNIITNISLCDTQPLSLLENDTKSKKYQYKFSRKNEEHTLTNLKLKARFQITELQTEGRIKLPLLILQEKFVSKLLHAGNNHLEKSVGKKFK